MRAPLRTGLLAGLLLLICVAPALAAKRVALVIGNDVYPKLPAEAQLRKAVNDAQAMAGKLRELGYTVTAGENADFRQFYALWEKFSAGVAPGDEVAIFFSGHGVAIKGQNFLVPVDAVPPKSGEQTAFRKQLIDLGELAEVLKDERQPRVALFIIDACRNNPFRSADGTRAIGGAKGLAMVEPPKGTFMMFSAGSGELALDRLSDTDPDPNSIYTRNLLPLLGQKGLTIQDVAQKVRAEVSSPAPRATTIRTQVIATSCWVSAGHCVLRGARTAQAKRQRRSSQRSPRHPIWRLPLGRRPRTAAAGPCSRRSSSASQTASLPISRRRS